MNTQDCIPEDIKGTGKRADAIINKIVDQVKDMKIDSTEPGVEIVQGLSTTIDMTIKDAISSGGDLSVISKAILIGAFRSNHYVQLEAHKTIRLLLQEMIKAVFNYRGNVKKAIGGLLDGIIDIAKEYQLNEQEALIITREDILLAAEKLDPKFFDDIKKIMPQHY